MQYTRGKAWWLIMIPGVVVTVACYADNMHWAKRHVTFQRRNNRDYKQMRDLPMPKERAEPAHTAFAATLHRTAHALLKSDITQGTVQQKARQLLGNWQIKHILADDTGCYEGWRGAIDVAQERGHTHTAEVLYQAQQVYYARQAHRQKSFFEKNPVLAKLLGLGGLLGCGALLWSFRDGISKLFSSYPYNIGQDGIYIDNDDALWIFKGGKWERRDNFGNILNHQWSGPAILPCCCNQQRGRRRTRSCDNIHNYRGHNHGNCCRGGRHHTVCIINH